MKSKLKRTIALLLCLVIVGGAVFLQMRKKRR